MGTSGIPVVSMMLLAASKSMSVKEKEMGWILLQSFGWVFDWGNGFGLVDGVARDVRFGFGITGSPGVRGSILAAMWRREKGSAGVSDPTSQMRPLK